MMKWTLLANQLWPNQFVLNTLLFLLTIVAIPKPAQAFDTGHHFDLTHDAMQDQGFGKTAIEVAQLENWLTDYYSSSPTSRIEDETNKLHFDNLFTTQQVGNYWGRFTVNTRDAIQQATREKNALKLLTVMGISLHAVQDFYTHSNWAESHPSVGNTYRTDTWFSQPAVGLNIFTGKSSSFQGIPPAGFCGRPCEHGDYSSGMNKDEYGRPNWDRSYTFAYAGSREWVNAMRTWSQQVDPNFWSQVQAFTVSGGDRSKLNDDLAALYRMSEWVKSGGEDGHWKGKGSGSRAEFLSFSAAWVAKPDGHFVSEFKDRKAYELISKGLTGNSPPTKPVPVVPRLPLQHRAVIVRTLKVAETNDLGLFETRIDPAGKADFYANVTVAGQKFTETMQLDKSSVNPAWTTMRFVRKNITSVPILYQLWDEDGITGDDHADINPKTKVRDLNFSLNVNTHALSGDLTGVHDTVGTAVTSTGKKSDNDRASVQLFVTEKSLNP